MKKKTFFIFFNALACSLVFLLFSLCCFSAQSQAIGPYKINRIEATKHYYLISVISSNLRDTMLVISKRTKSKSQSKNNIQLNKMYDLKLEPYFSKAELDKFPQSPDGMIIGFDEKLIAMSYTSVPFTTVSLNGLVLL